MVNKSVGGAFTQILVMPLYKHGWCLYTNMGGTFTQTWVVPLQKHEWCLYKNMSGIFDILTH